MFDALTNMFEVRVNFHRPFESSQYLLKHGNSEEFIVK